MIENLQNSKIQPLPSFSAKDMPVDILRLDLLHPVVSGNKWFKLNYYLKDALAQEKTTLATFGGAYSNHIVAAAFAAKEAGMKSRGFIRGIPSLPSPTLQQAMAYGMELTYIEREQFRNKASVIRQYHHDDFYWVMEGGYGIPGSKGAAGILQAADTTSYTHILCAVGTGTMLSGLIRSARDGQTIIGTSALKNNTGLEAAVSALLDEGHRHKPFSINHDYHFGGYAKHPPALIGFMNELWHTERLPTDIVYTAKLLFAARDLLSKNFFPPQARILLIHSGGLQGNGSLAPGTLPFL